MPKRYSAFISYRFDSSQREVIEWFKKKIEAFEIDCYIANEKKSITSIRKDNYCYSG
jgi:hypothetical protein